MQVCLALVRPVMESPLRAVWKFCHSGAAAAIIIGAAYSVFSGLGQLGASLVVFVVGLVASVAVVVGAERLRARAGAAASAESFGTRSQCQPFFRWWPPSLSSARVPVPRRSRRSVLIAKRCVDVPVACSPGANQLQQATLVYIALALLWAAGTCLTVLLM